MSLVTAEQELRIEALRQAIDFHRNHGVLVGSGEQTARDFVIKSAEAFYGFIAVKAVPARQSI